MESITNKNFIIPKVLGQKAVKLWQVTIVYGSGTVIDIPCQVQVFKSAQLRFALKKLHIFRFVRKLFIVKKKMREGSIKNVAWPSKAFDLAFNKQIR